MDILRETTATTLEDRPSNRRLGRKGVSRTGAILTVAALLAAGCATDGSASATRVKASGVSTSAEPTPSGPQHSSENGSAYTGALETAEWSAPIFEGLTPSTAITIGRTAVGGSYLVLCRIPPRSGQPDSVADGGWYELADTQSLPVGGDVAANTFDNGRLPNNRTYDPSIPVCPSE